MECKYRKGDKVIIRHDLDTSVVYRMVFGPYKGQMTCNAVDPMVKNAGKTATIKDVEGNGRGYWLEEYRFLWSDEMFEGPAKMFVCHSLL